MKLLHLEFSLWERTGSSHICRKPDGHGKSIAILLDKYLVRVGTQVLREFWTPTGSAGDRIGRSRFSLSLWRDSVYWCLG